MVLRPDIELPVLADHHHPMVRSTAKKLIAGKKILREKLESVFLFVRDEIKFGFPLEKWDDIKASETIKLGIGYCNSKATLFLALCRAAGLPARIHTALIDPRIMKGVFPGFVFSFLPKAVSHSWIEVLFHGEWKPLDSYINDQDFFAGAIRMQEKKGIELGYSLASGIGECSCAFNFGEKGFVHMAAITEDHGIWTDFSEYMASYQYVRLKSWQNLTYPFLAAWANWKVEKVRSGEGLKV